MKTLALLAAALISASPALAGIRVIHASPDAPNVDVYVNAVPGPGVSPAISNLAFTQGTPYIGLPTGAYDFRVTPAGATPVVLSVLGFNANQNTDYTVAAIDNLASIEALALVDDNTTNPTNARIRFVHASPDAPNVDIRVAGGGPVLFSNIAFRGNGGYVTVPGGTYNLEVTVAGTSTVALSLPGVSVSNGAVYSVFAMGNLANLQAVTFVDVVPAPGSLGLLAAGALVTARRRR